MSPNMTALFISGIYLLLALVFACIAFGIHISIRKKRKRCTSQTIGKVVDCQRIVRHDSDGSSTASWYPTFSYYANGTQYEKRSSFGTARPKFQQGQSVTVFYDPMKPEYYFVLEEKNSFFVKVFGLVSALLFVVAIIVLVIYFKLF